MDVQVFLIAAVVFVISAVVIYLISAITMKEKTFDEVIAEQKLQDEKEKARAKIDKKLDKSVSKKKGKKKEKLKEKADLKEHKMVNLEIDPEIIEPTEVLRQEMKPKGKSKKMPKSILVNKGEKIVVGSSRNVKEIKHDIYPKDELELKREHEKNGQQQQVRHKVNKKTESSPDKSPKDVRSTQKVTGESIKAEMKSQTAPEKKGKKSKPDTSDTDKSPKDVRSAQKVTGESIKTEMKSQAAPEKKGKKSKPNTSDTDKSSKDVRSTQKVTGESIKNEMKSQTAPEKKGKQSKPNTSDTDKSPKDVRSTQKVTGESIKNEMKTQTAPEKKGKKSKPNTSDTDKSPKDVRSTQKVTEELMKSQTAPEKKGKKSKANTPVTDEKSMNKRLDGSFLISTVKSASLGEADAQVLIDFLINKYGGVGKSGQDWNKKSKGGDPVSLLRKQLEEKERSLQEEQQLAMSANNKWKELKQEMTHQKTSYTATEKQLTDKMSVLAQEKHALQTRMQKTHEQHMLEMEHMQSQIQQLEAIADEARMQHLTEENKMLKEKMIQKQNEPQVDVTGMRRTMTILENELSSNVMKLNVAENGKKTLETKVNKYEEQIKKLDANQKDFDLVLNKRLEEVSKVLRREEARSSSLNKDLQKSKATTKYATTECENLKHELKNLEKANDSLKAAENECNTLKTCLSDLEMSASYNTKEIEGRLKDSEGQRCDTELQLQDLQIRLEDSEQGKSDLESNIKNLEKKFYELDQERRDTKSESDKLLRDNSSLQEKLKDDERHRSDLERNIKNLENMTKDYDQQRQEFEDKLEHLRNENNVLSDELNMEREKPVEITIETEKPLGASATNGDIQQEDVQNLNKITVEQEKMLSEKENEITKLVSELDSRKKDVLEFEEQLESQKKKNNELREKNWKAMEALEKAEKSLSGKLQGAVQTAMDRHCANMSETEKYDKQIVQRIFPSISLKETIIESDVTYENDEKDFSAQSNDAHREWMSRFENEAIVYLDSLSSKSASSGSEVENLQKEIEEREAKVKNLEDNNDKLQSQIQDYRSVLAQTENKLQQLENSVELEEKKWQERLQITQSDLEQAKQELSVLSEDMQNFRGSQEMEDKMQTLQSSLHASEDRYQLIQQQAKQAEEKNLQLEEKLEQAKKASVTINDISKDLEELRRLLEEERRKNKALASSHIKLNGIIKTGQDALQQEQDLVKKFQEQLQDRNKQHGVGSQEVGELRGRLGNLEKQLEKELTTNKHLTERLAATGAGDAGSTTTL